jgi:hypothetical protein
MALQGSSQRVTGTQPEETMVKRVAQALADREPENWPQHVLHAKRVLLAMRGPTESMLAAVEKNTLCWQGLMEDWDAMLNQAVTDG